MKYILFALLIPVVISSNSYAQSSEFPVQFIPGITGGDQYNPMAWEVISEHGETLLPDVFYADPIQNIQIMPLPVEDECGRYEINHLIYPTLGNPNLYIKSDSTDSMMVVLRLEDKHLSHLKPKTKRHERTRFNNVFFENEDNENEITFSLVQRIRGLTRIHNSMNCDQKKVKSHSIYPVKILTPRNTTDWPDQLKQRKTLQVYFNQQSMKSIPPGLYDIQFDVKMHGTSIVSERHYNAVRVFNQTPSAENGYSVINVTDSQVSIGKKDSFRYQTLSRLRDFVEEVNQSKEDNVRNAAFITFNGDLHNGGSPTSLFPEKVSHTYNREAGAILRYLKELTIPIFLVPGNHDGYVSFGHVPDVFNDLASKSIEQVVQDVSKHSLGNFQKYIKATQSTPGGREVDVFSGRFVRRNAQQNINLWQFVDDSQANLVLYDGFYQWRKVYGPLYSAWKFSDNLYININSFDLRQHMRSGWGMYTINYGGGISQLQMGWIKKEVRRHKDANDIILLAHHDPRGGHKGKNFPYYFKQAPYSGIPQSIKNFIKGEVLLPWICKSSLKNSKHIGKIGIYEEDCLTDGLQEWMRADPKFDCSERELFKNGPHAGTCDTKKYHDPKTRGKVHPIYSGYQLIHLMNETSSIRTFLLGHTHYNSAENYRSGEDLIPHVFQLDSRSRQHIEETLESGVYDSAHLQDELFKTSTNAWENDLSYITELEGMNPLRYTKELNQSNVKVESEKDLKNFQIFQLLHPGIESSSKGVFYDLHKAGHSLTRSVSKHKGVNRELLILRLTSVSTLTQQKEDISGKKNFGFSVFGFSKMTNARDRKYDFQTLNSITSYRNASTYLLNKKSSHEFEDVGTMNLDRNQRFNTSSDNNPLRHYFPK